MKKTPVFPVVLSLVFGIFIGIFLYGWLIDTDVPIHPGSVPLNVSYDDPAGILELYPIDLSKLGAHEHPQLNVARNGAPTVELEVTRDPKSPGDFLVHIITENFVFAPESVSTEHVPGEGHAHIFVNDVKLSRALSEWYHLPTLHPGTHTVLVTLSSNDHREYAISGRSIMDEIVIEVPFDREMNMDSMPCHQMSDGTWMGQCDNATLQS